MQARRRKPTKPGAAAQRHERVASAAPLAGARCAANASSARANSARASAVTVAPHS